MGVCGSTFLFSGLCGSDISPINVRTQDFTGNFAAAFALDIYCKRFPSAAMPASNLFYLPIRSAAALREGNQLVFVKSLDKFKEGHAVLHYLEQRIATAIEVINSICYFIFGKGC
jgi:hypothetical protein